MATDNNDPLVIAPGGPLPASRVVHVRPGQIIEHDDSGGHVITPGDDSDTFVTPGGPRPRSRVHFVEDGMRLHNTGQQIHLIDHKGAVLSRVNLEARTGTPSDNMGSGYITNTYWHNKTHDPISVFATTWKVPSAPSTQSGQTVFLFNGLVPTDFSHILQPVLQWGRSAAGGGNYWSVASWFVGGGHAFYTQLVQVEVGDELIGQMVLDSCSGSIFNYTSSFTNVANTALRLTNNPELTWAYEALEAYKIKKCSDYPATDNTPMTNINISMLKRPSLKWTVENKVTDCGQKSIIAVDGADNGEVEVFYRKVT